MLHHLLVLYGFQNTKVNWKLPTTQGLSQERAHMGVCHSIPPHTSWKVTTPNAPNFICLGVNNIQVKHNLLREEFSSFLHSLLPSRIHCTLHAFLLLTLCTIGLEALKDDETTFIIDLAETFSPMPDTFRMYWNVRAYRNMETLLVSQPYIHQIQHDTTWAHCSEDCWLSTGKVLGSPSLQAHLWGNHLNYVEIGTNTLKWDSTILWTWALNCIKRERQQSSSIHCLCPKRLPRHDHLSHAPAAMTSLTQRPCTLELRVKTNPLSLKLLLLWYFCCTGYSPYCKDSIII